MDVLHTRTRGTRQQAVPADQPPETHTHTQSFHLGGHYRAPYSKLRWPTFAVSKSGWTKRPAKLPANKEASGREVNASTSQATGGGDRALFG